MLIGAVAQNTVRSRDKELRQTKIMDGKNGPHFGTSHSPHGIGTINNRGPTPGRVLTAVTVSDQMHRLPREDVARGRGKRMQRLAKRAKDKVPMSL